MKIPKLKHAVDLPRYGVVSVVSRGNQSQTAPILYVFSSVPFECLYFFEVRPDVSGLGRGQFFAHFGGIGKQCLQLQWFQ